GWFSSLKDCAAAFIRTDRTFEPVPKNVKRYRDFYQVYKDVYPHTVAINHQLFDLRRVNESRFGGKTDEI
ncbi:xylulokinase, partial [Weizmannia sp. CD-2023]|nr:xylulokinase [Weizmannia sp. CD-2023]